MATVPQLVRVSAVDAEGEPCVCDFELRIPDTGPPRALIMVGDDTIGVNLADLIEAVHILARSAAQEGYA